MEKATCATCQKTKTSLKCGLCTESTCKTCAHLLDANAFSFLTQVPEKLSKGVYCHACFQSKVAAHLAAYEQTMKAALEINIYFKNQGKETRFIRREAAPYVIQDCADREELTLRLAFLAAQNGFTTLVDVDIRGEKVREGSYQKTIYHGSATPTNGRGQRIPKDKSARQNSD